MVGGNLNFLLSWNLLSDDKTITGHDGYRNMAVQIFDRKLPDIPGLSSMSSMISRPGFKFCIARSTFSAKIQ